MNSVGRLLPNVGQTSTSKVTAMKEMKDIATSFEQILNGANEKEVSPEDGKEGSLNPLIETLKGLLSDLGLDIHQVLQGSEVDKGSGEQSVESLFEAMKSLSEGELTSQFQAMMTNISNMGESVLSNAEKKKLTGLLQSIMELMKPEGSQMNMLISINNEITDAEMITKSYAEIEAKLEALWDQFRGLTKNLPGGQSLPSELSTKRMLALKEVLENFTTFTKRMPIQNSEQFRQTISQITKQGTTQQKDLFVTLLTNYRSRQSVPQSYHQQSPVGGKDIAKWVSQALAKQNNGTVEQTSLSQTATSQHSSMPMSKVEQFVIHVNQNQSSSSMQKQMMQEFERVLQSSRFLTNKAGNMEMQLKLRPSHLGDMSVKLAQINGELTVKILVSTQAAKEMLESNMGQLRHMFSPQQVVIEKNEQLATQQHFYQESDLEDGDSEGRHKEHSQQEQEQTEDDNKEELSFHEILMNEKV